MTVLRVNVLIVENVNVAARRQKVSIQSGSSPLLHDLGTKETGHPDRFHLYTSEVKKRKANVLFVLVSDIFCVTQKRLTWRVSCGVSAASCDWVCESFNMSVYL